ncbi:MAG: tetratricopeptide repeat protein [Waddliaceae bacterium]
MMRINWKEKLGWGEEHVEDLRLAGYAYIRQGRYDIALTFFEALCVLDPESAYDTQTLGALYVQLSRPKDALKYLDRALKIDGDHAPTLINLSKALLMLGKKQEGLKLARILSKEKDPSVSNIARALMLAYEE